MDNNDPFIQSILNTLRGLDQPMQFGQPLPPTNDTMQFMPQGMMPQLQGSVHPRSPIENQSVHERTPPYSPPDIPNLEEILRALQNAR